VGEFPSIALDASGYPHISYYDGTNADLKYARWDGSAWRIETVDSMGNVGAYTSIALDASGYPHISYAKIIYFDGTSDLDLKYAHWTGNAWSIETVDSAGNVGAYTSIALDASGYPHISYYISYGESWSTGARALKYAHWTGSSWSIETVDSQVLWEGSSIAIDASGRPHIAYQGDYNTHGVATLKYARWTGSSWSIETVDSASMDRLIYPSIALDASGYPQISYSDVSAGLKYARWTGSAWSIQTIDSGSGSGETSLALDASGRPHISYVHRGIKYAEGPLNTAPTLVSGSVYPASGSTGDSFTYEVTYADVDGDPPAYVTVCIDGAKYSMGKIYGTYAGGALYRYATSALGPSSHIYYFETSDGTDTVSLPSSSTYSGPSVTAADTAPSLTSGSVSPSSGTTSTNFTFEVTYSNANGNAPSYVTVHIDGFSYSMSKVSGDYTIGATYQYTTSSLSTGSHTYYFETSNGTYTARLPSSGSYNGPSVTNPLSPPPPGTSPWIYVGAVVVIVVIIAAVMILKFV
jgi:hypothetical protein